VKSNTKIRFVLFSLIAGLFWGTSFPVVKLGLNYISPIWFAELRLFFAFLCLFLFIKRRKIILKFPYEYWLLGFFNATSFLLQFLGMQYTSASKTAFYINSNLIFVAIFSFLFLKEKFGWNKILGISLAIIGIYLLSIGLNPIDVLFSGHLNGDLLILSSGLSWGFFMVINKRMVHHLEYSTLENVTLFLFTSSVLLLPVAFIFEPVPTQIAWQGWVLLCFSSTISMAIPFFFWSLGLKGLTATVSSLLILVELLMALSLSYLFLNETLTIVEIFGAFILISAIIFASLDSMKRKTSEVVGFVEN
jgi:drug/metabolite transporter (DMT)-like permease